MVVRRGIDTVISVVSGGIRALEMAGLLRARGINRKLGRGPLNITRNSYIRDFNNRLVDSQSLFGFRSSLLNES